MFREVFPFLIVCPLVFLGGFVDAVAGGGGLISLPAYMLAGLPAHTAIATNKLSSSMGTATATWRYAKAGYIPWSQAGFCAAAALAGSSVGARLALLLSDAVFKRLMLVLLPLIAVYVLRGKSLDTEKEPYSESKTRIIAVGVALALGIYDGFYGPGAGAFLLLLLTSAAHMKLSTANGVSKVINLSANVAALSVYLINGKVLPVLGLTAGCFGIAGNYIGARFFSQRGSGAVRPLMILVLVAFFIKLLIEIG